MSHICFYPKSRNRRVSSTRSFCSLRLLLSVLTDMQSEQIFASSLYSLFKSMSFFLLPQLSAPSRDFTLTTKLYDPRIYQRDSGDGDLLASNQLLRGLLTLVVHRPMQTSSVSVKLTGHSTSDCSSNVILDETITWDYTCDGFLMEGVYTYPFQFLVALDLPETYKSSYLTIAYKVETHIGYDSKGQSEHQVVTFVKCVPSESSILYDSLTMSGNWRNLLKYEFYFQNKVVFPDTPYTASLTIVPIRTQSFQLHSISIWVAQYIEIKGKLAEANKFLFEEQEIDDPDATEFLLPVTFPPLLKLQLYDHISESKKFLYPDFGNIGSDVHIHHKISIQLEISESQCRTELEIDGTDLGSAIAFKHPMSPICFSPSRRQQLHKNRFKRVELAYRAPIIFLDKISLLGIVSPPLYQHSMDIEDTSNKTDVVSDWGTPPPYYNNTPPYPP